MKYHITSPDNSSVSQFAFGTMQFGHRATEADSAAMFEASLAAGITHFDTAYVYTDGQAETILGKLAAPHRDSLVIATKVGYFGGCGRGNLFAQFDVSQQRLNMDMVDVLYLHRFDQDTDLGETMDALAELKQAGKIRYIGLSNFAAWQVMKAVMEGAKRDLTIDIMQPMYNLVKRQAEVEILPMCADQGIFPTTYSPLGGGLLTGKYRTANAKGRLHEMKEYTVRYGQEFMHHTARELSILAKDIGTHPATLACAWAAAHPSAPSPILSARNMTQLAPSLAALNFDMSADLYDRIVALSPTPPPATDRLEEA